MGMVNRIQEYYRRIDAGDIAWVIGLFAEDGCYDRAGTIYHGRGAIRNFYERERKVRMAHHDLEFWGVGNHVFVEGSFRGAGADESITEGQFADHWQFDGAGHVVHRRTSLFVGAELIR